MSEDTTDGGPRRGIDEAAGDVASEVVPALPDSLAAARDRLLADADRPTGDQEPAARDRDADTDTDADSGPDSAAGPSPDRVLRAALEPIADADEGATDGQTAGLEDGPRPSGAGHPPEREGEVAEE